MPKLNTLKSLGSLFLSSIKTSPAVDKSLKHFVSSLDASSALTPKRTLNSHKRPQPSKPPSPSHLSSLVTISVDTSSCSDSEDPTRQVSHDTSSKLSDGLSVDLLGSEGDNGGNPLDALEVIYSFVDSCAVRLGTAATLNICRKLGDEVRLGTAVFRKLGGETVMELFNALLKNCIETASTTDDWMVALEQVSIAFEVFNAMNEHGFPIEEGSYGQVLLYLIGRGMVGHFHRFTDVIRYGSASTLARLGYYEMLLYIRVNDKEKFEEFINCIFTSDGDGTIRVNDEEMFEEFINCIFTSDGDETISLRDGLSVDLLDSEGDNGGKPSEDALEVPYRLVDSCAVGLGTAVKKFNALLKILIETACITDDLIVAALEFFISIKEQGFPIEEESYGQVLLYLIDRGMVGYFHRFTDIIRYDGSASTLARLGYYEMLLYIRVNDKEKVQEFINSIFTSDGDGTISLRDGVPRAVVDVGDC